ncbi:hypothetical protein CC80DRAFT_43810 [Byssothecium circinans]|uniref:Uncharacterized protein n=1 Tax=Byssothecium circinans TaxID=147558 RepID=A0A6A5TZA3_9PLEO|nr:hypothetical protein CC80DRAFT_43810 [Byssothecium circinans]
MKPNKLRQRRCQPGAFALSPGEPDSQAFWKVGRTHDCCLILRERFGGSVEMNLSRSRPTSDCGGGVLFPVVSLAVYIRHRSECFETRVYMQRYGR